VINAAKRILQRQVRAVIGPRRLAAIEARVFWMLGSPRSGSTWLLAMLADLDRVVAINEPLIGYYLGSFLSDIPGFRGDTLTSDDCLFRQSRAKVRAQFFADEFTGVWRPQLREMILERFEAYAQRYPSRDHAERPLLVVKEPNGSQSADILLRTLPTSGCLFLLRDGRDVVDSGVAAVSKGSWVGRNFPGLAGIEDEDRLSVVEDEARKWLWRTEIVERAFENHRGPKKLVRYEDLIADPHAGFSEIVTWLGLAPDEKMLRDIIERHAFANIPEDQRGATEFARSATPGAWRTNLSSAEQDVVHAVLGEKLRALGYEPHV
jgi:hypothetical protein